MTFRRLVIGQPSGPLGTDTFVWRSVWGESSFYTNLDPELRLLGDVTVQHRDLVAFATAAFLADRTVPRPAGWHRAIELEVPVYVVAEWKAVANQLAETLEILSGDSWKLAFTPRSKAKKLETSEHPSVDRVLLFSGGADSLCGAIRSLVKGERVLLVSHWDWGGHSSVQKALARQLSTRFPEQLARRAIQLSRRSKQIGGGTFGNDVTRRTRSLLFLSLGLAVSSVEPEAPLWIAENGYTGLNLPLAGERRGALSTRTTHPLVLGRVRDAVRMVGGRAEFENPFASMTKGEMFAEVASSLDKQEAEKMLGVSHSCSHARYATGTGYRPDTQCGICFGCLVRRAAFHSSGLNDSTTYLHKVIPRSQQPAHLQSAAESEIRAVRYAGQRGVNVADLLAVGLPNEVDIDDALGVAQRGLAELTTIVDTEPDLRAVQ